MDLFKHYCLSNKLYEAQTLYYVCANSSNKIDIHINNDYIFRMCCGYGYFEMAKWLYSLNNINISTCHNYAFKMACINNHKQIVNWLHSLNCIHIDTIKESINLVLKNNNRDMANFLQQLYDTSITHYNDMILEQQLCNLKL